MPKISFPSVLVEVELFSNNIKPREKNDPYSSWCDNKQIMTNEAGEKNNY